MSNIFLEKIASQKNPDKKSTPVTNALLAGVGAHTALQGPQKLLGYHTVYHGTPSASAARNIKENGLKKSYGGTAGSKISAGGGRFEQVAKEHVYVTKSKNVARTFAGNSAKYINEHGHASHKAGLAAMKDYFTGEGKVLKARIPHNVYIKRHELDPDSFDWVTRATNPKDKLKDIASRTKGDISSKYISGGRGSKGAATFLHKNHLRRYYKSASGRARAAVGAAEVVGGTALSAVGAYRSYTQDGLAAKIARKKVNNDR